MDSLTYSQVVSLGDFGPWISKLIISIPDKIVQSQSLQECFSIYCERRENDGTLLLRKEHNQNEEKPSVGYVDILSAYPCDSDGVHLNEPSNFVALELPETRLTKQVEGNVMGSRYIKNCFRITQTKPLISYSGNQITGLVFDSLSDEMVPSLTNWHNTQMSQPCKDIQLQYGYFEPKADKKIPLILWLHGAGEGSGYAPTDEGPTRAYTGNKVTALSSPSIQNYFDGGAWVVVPQCPTFWMDDGVEKLGRSNQSIYVQPLKMLLDEFIALHGEKIDLSRIVIGGLSNGGFMTIRMCVDYPEVFSAGIAICAPFYVENQTSEAIEALTKTPIWFVHAKNDELVNPKQTSIPLYKKLKELNTECHFTYFNDVHDLTGIYKEADGSSKKIFDHGVWVHVFNDFCHTDFDSTAVIYNGEPVGIWEWSAKQCNSKGDQNE